MDADALLRVEMDWSMLRSIKRLNLLNRILYTRHSSSMTSSSSSFDCCKAGFAWQGTPSGSIGKIASLDTYIAQGGSSQNCILMIHDIFGWTLNNARLLADAYAKHTGATVYLPDFYHGDVVTPEMMSNPAAQKDFSLAEFFTKHNKDARYPEIQAVVKDLRSAGYSKIGAIGFCWGGWAVFRLAGKHERAVDFISTAHPSLLTKDEITNLAQPTQVMAPETDRQFTPELKALTQRVLQENKVEHEYIDFPGLVHGFSVRGDQSDETQKAGLEKAMQDFINWSNKHFKQ